MSDNHEDLAVQQALEKEIRGMERRIKHLERRRREGDAPAGEPITLHVPYRTMSDHHQATNPNANEPSMELKRQWLDMFLQHSDQFGLFLHPTRFWQAALDETSAQSPFLRHCAHLCGAAVARAPNLSLLLLKALQRRLNTIGAGAPRLILEHIQGEILLSRYFFYANKPLEALYHSATSEAMVTLAGLPYLGTSQRLRQPLQVDDGERIRGLWRAVEFDLILSISRQGMTNMSGYTNDIENITTPFPRPLGEYEMGSVRDLPLEYPVRDFRQSSGTVSMTRECDESLSAKVIVLWYWAYRHEQNQRQQTGGGGAHHQLHDLSILIHNFAASLPPPSTALTSISAHTKIRAATITLHRDNAMVSGESNGKCIQAATEIFRLVTLIPTSVHFLDATFPLAWWAAAECLAKLVKDWNSQMVNNLRVALARMLAFEATCPRMRGQLSQIRMTLQRPLSL